MPRMNVTTRLLAALAITGAAVAAAFTIPLAADAMTITLFGDGSPSVVGSGKNVAVVRKVAAFSTLRMDGPIDVTAHPGAAPEVTVHADDNVEPLIETVVEGDTLIVRPRKGTGLRTSHRLVVDVVFTTLEATHQNGSGDLQIGRVAGTRLDSAVAGSGDLRIDDAQLAGFALSVAGSGDVSLHGNADDARYSVAGSGDIDAHQLSSRHVAIDISGSGDVRVDASESLDARVSGSGDVVYSGHPRDVQRRLTGSGSVTAAR